MVVVWWWCGGLGEWWWCGGDGCHVRIFVVPSLHTILDCYHFAHSPTHSFIFSFSRSSNHSHPFTPPFIKLPTLHPSIYPSTFPPTHSFIHLFILPSIHPSIHPAIHLSTTHHPFIHQLKDHLEACQRNYEALNDQLAEELPPLFTAVSAATCHSIHLFNLLLRNFHRTLRTRFEALLKVCRPSLLPTRACSPICVFTT